MIGQNISHYQITAMLGEGGMGVVYKAEDIVLGRPVALKFLPRCCLASDQQRARFLREARAAARIEHPNICTVHEIGEADGVNFIAMALLEGEDLARRLKSGKPTVGQSIEIAIQVAAGLNAAHQKGVIHRDIKPANIFLTADGRTVILDFGLAHLPGAEQITENDFTPGTTAYMSPEQTVGEPVDARTDLWSLGIVLYEMLTGQRPFQGEYVQAIHYAVLHEAPVPPSRLNPDVSTLTDRVLAKLLAKRRYERYSEAGEVAADLRAIAGGSARRDAPSRIARPVSVTTPSLAVLPFANLSSDREDEYFTDGLTEEITNALTQLPGLKVASRTSAFYFKGKNQTISTIAEQLQAAVVLEGSVRRSGSRIRVTAQLINASDGYHIWSERFDREMKDIFELQDEITCAIVGHLRMELGGEESLASAKRSTADPRAYDHYLRGRARMQFATPAHFTSAIECYQQAIALDPNFARSFGSMAIARMLLVLMGWKRPLEAVPAAKSDAHRALALDPADPDATFALAFAGLHFDWNWWDAEQRFLRAIELNPSDGWIRAHYGVLLSWTGRSQEAVAAAREGVRVDPFNVVAVHLLCATLTYACRFEEAIETSSNAIKSEPNYHPFYWWLGISCSMTGDHERAIGALQRGLVLSQSEPLTAGVLGWSFAIAGNVGEARKRRFELIERRQSEYVGATSIAFICTALGDRDAAFEWLETAYLERDGILPLLKVGAFFRPLHGDPRHADLLRRMNLDT